jgi:AmiR/NasT family two-component response regulator
MMSSRVEKLTQERDAAEKSVQNQKIIQRAKALLMNEFKITENEAHRILQKRSMDTGMTLVNVAQIILKQ